MHTLDIKLREVFPIQLSARNQFKGRVTEVKNGPVSTEIILDVNGLPITASITTGSAESLGLKAGDDAVAIIKASSVMVAK